LSEKALAYELVVQMPWKQGKEFLKMNPVGTLPVLVESDGHILVDHMAICEYLNEAEPFPNLLGETPRGRAEVRRLENWMDTDFYMDVFKPLVGERVYKSLQSNSAPNSTLIRAGRENLKRYLGYLDWICARRSYLGGRNLSLADFGAASHLSILDYIGEMPWDGYPDLKLWYAKIKSRPSFNALLNDRIAGIIPSQSYSNLDF
jgi:glutathione S-transferase